MEREEREKDARAHGGVAQKRKRDGDRRRQITEGEKKNKKGKKIKEEQGDDKSGRKQEINWQKQSGGAEEGKTTKE